MLLLDEPFSSLGLDTRRQVRAEVLAVLPQASIPVVLVTHDREQTLAMGDEVLVLGHPPQEHVARLAGVENLLRVRMERVSAAEDTLTCRAGGFVPEVPPSDAKPGDVLLPAAEPVGLSDRNVRGGP